MMPRTKLDFEYDSLEECIPSSQITVDEKCSQWINKNGGD